MDRYRIFNAGSDLHPAAAWAPAEVTHFARTKYLYSQHANVGAEPAPRYVTGHVPDIVFLDPNGHGLSHRRRPD